MDWSNESWVRLYTRDTEDELVLSWDARAVWREMLRKFDRSGLIELKRGNAGLAAMLRCDVAVVERALPELLADGRIQQVPNGYFAPNFMEAQEAPASDAQRKRVSRENRRAKARDAADGQTVTNRDVQPEPVTNRDELSVDPRPGSLLPNLTFLDQGAVDRDSDPDPHPSEADPEQGVGGDRLQHARLVNRFLSRVNAARVEVATAHNLGPSRPITLMDGGAGGERDLRARLSASADPASDLEHVLDVAIAEAHDKAETRWLSWSLANEKSWRSRLAASLGEVGSRRAGPRRVGDAIGSAKPRTDHPDEPGLKSFKEL